MPLNENFKAKPLGIERYATLLCLFMWIRDKGLGSDVGFVTESRLQKLIV